MIFIGRSLKNNYTHQDVMISRHPLRDLQLLWHVVKSLPPANVVKKLILCHIIMLILAILIMVICFIFCSDCERGF